MAENARDILTGAGILVFLCALCLYFPVAGFVCFLLLPLPEAFYRIKLGRRAGSLPALIAAAGVWMLIGGRAVDFWMILCMLALGFALGDALEKNLSIEKTIAYPCGLVWLAGLAALVVFGNLAESGPWGLASDYVKKNLELTAATYRRMDMPEQSVRLLAESLDRIHYVIMRIMPALAAAGLVFSAWVNVLLARVTFPFWRLKLPDFGPLNRWKAPDAMVWGVIGCALLMLVSDGTAAFIGANGLILLMLVYLFQGIAVISFYFEQRRVPMFVRLLIYAFIAMQQVFALLVIGLGFFDTWIDFRRLAVKNNGDAGSS